MARIQTINCLSAAREMVIMQMTQVTAQASTEIVVFLMLSNCLKTMMIEDLQHNSEVHISGHKDVSLRNRMEVQTKTRTLLEKCIF